jgi:DNA-3-methyladenine glycosylase
VGTANPAAARRAAGRHWTGLEREGDRAGAAVELIAREFFARPSREVAPDLLGCVLAHDTAEGVVAVELTEVEAYEGVADPASHSFRGQTPRNAIMWGPPGFAYVYFIYGMYFCVNVICQPTGTSSGILIRAGRVTAGEPLARQRRMAGRRAPSGPETPAKHLPANDLARGPGLLCLAMAITQAENGLDLVDPASSLRLYAGEPDRPVVAEPIRLAGRAADPEPSPRVSSGPRVGVTAAADVPWRFWLTGDPTVSAYRPHKARTTRPVSHTDTNSAGEG